MELAAQILKAKDRYALLSLGRSEPIKLNPDGYLNVEDEDVRRAYMKLAAKVHPDKLVGYPDATRAFQALVRAYELCCKPNLRADDSDDSRDDSSDEEDEDDAGGDEDDVDSSDDDADADVNDSSDDDDDDDDYEDESTGGANKEARKALPAAGSSSASRGKAPAAAPKKAKAPAKARAQPTSKAKASGSDKAKPRQNGGAVRTVVTCPRCFAEWGSHLKAEGNEAAYSDFMQGQCQVHCLRCLFEFGVLTAGHGCPECKRPVEYRPSLYRRKITCPNDKRRGAKACGITFSIMHYARSSAKAAEAAAAAKEEEAGRRKREDAAASRAERSARNGLADEDGWLEELGAFIVSEDCPRCGKTFTAGHAAHLKKCKGTKNGGGGGGTGGASSSGGGKKRKQSDAAWMVGSYDDKDGAYREPKKPRGGGGGSAAAKKAPKEKAKVAAAKQKQKPTAAKAAAAPKAGGAKKPAAKAGGGSKGAGGSSKPGAMDQCEDCGEDCKPAKKGPSLCAYCKQERLEDA